MRPLHSTQTLRDRVTVLVNSSVRYQKRLSLSKNTTLLFAVLTLIVLLEACVYVPRSTQVFDSECQVVANHMELQEVQIAAIHQCRNQECIALILVASAVTAASVIVSGSIVVAGNIAYWFERKSHCQMPQ